MIKIKFNDVDIYEKYNVVLENFKIGVPSPKLVKVSIPGRDGDIDMSESLTGFVNYQNRDIELNLGITGLEDDIEKRINKLLTLIASKKVKLEFSHLSGYFSGRAEIKEITRDVIHYGILVSVDCEPYRYDLEETIKETELTEEEKIIRCNSSHMPINPTLVVTARADLKYKGKWQSFEKGEHKLNSYFTDGVNALTVKGSGSLIIKYRKGSL